MSFGDGGVDVPAAEVWGHGDQDIDVPNRLGPFVGKAGLLFGLLGAGGGVGAGALGGGGRGGRRHL